MNEFMLTESGNDRCYPDRSCEFLHVRLLSTSDEHKFSIRGVES